MRSPGFRSGSGQPAPAERLHAHHGADLIAVDVDVADAAAALKRLGLRFDARVHTQGESVPGAVDALGNGIDVGGPEPHYVQNGTEHFALERVEGGNLDGQRSNEGPLGARLREHELADRHALGLDPGLVLLEHRLGLGIDHGSDVGCEPGRIAYAQLAHVSGQQLDGASGDVLLHEEDTQRRAALAGAVEGGAHGIHGNLFGQRRGVGQHRVLPAGLGDENGDRALARRESAMDQLRGLGRPGERYACDIGIGDQAVADFLARSG
jgi:hypothetical protein